MKLSSFFQKIEEDFSKTKDKLSAKKARCFEFCKTATFKMVLIILTASFFGFLAGSISGVYFYNEAKEYLRKFKIEAPKIEAPPSGKIIEREIIKEYAPQTTQEEATINVVKEASPSVVSIVISKDMPIFEEYYTNPFGEGSPFEIQIPSVRQKGTQKQEIGGGTGFVVSDDGLILTNKHVVSDKEAEYTVLTNDGKRYPAKVLALDPVQDLAIIKISGADKNLKSLVLGDSDNLQIGQTVIAIGNALGEFRNTVSVGVVSGLARTVTASGGGTAETIEDVIQTDAAINRGNSGGPLLNLKGEIIGINTATAQGAENIGFSIPINKAKKDIESVKKSGKIIYPFLGVRYMAIDESVQKKNNLSVNYGAWVLRGDKPQDVAVTPGSPAEKAGIQENDIILEFNGKKINAENSLAKLIQKYNAGDKIVLKILRSGKEKIIYVTLGQRNE